MTPIVITSGEFEGKVWFRRQDEREGVLSFATSSREFEGWIASCCGEENGRGLWFTLRSALCRRPWGDGEVLTSLDI